MATESEPRSGNVPFPTPRYSLRGLLIAITVFAVVVAAIFSAPDILALPVLASAFFVTPTLLLVGIMRNRLVAYLRAFSIGVLLAFALAIPFIIYLFAITDYAPDYDPYFTSRSARVLYEITLTSRSSVLVLLIGAPVLGIISVAIRWGRMHADVSLEKSHSSEIDA